ncbi:MAG: shikimate dehydrogenase [Candidatus Hadarchaeota archaeon]|nr:shikimate dehydrogenase [Candidatus Hadarchaeota archaeon]
MTSGGTKLFALMGDPVERSLSPAIHNAAFKELGLDCVYVALRVARGSLPEAVKGIKALGIGGLNVTTPHKVDIVHLLDELDESASRVGAVNAVKNEDGKLIGFNTDGRGAVKALKEGVGELRGRKVVLLGAGGAARAIAFSLAEAGVELTLANRTASKARKLAASIEQKLGSKVKQVELKQEVLKGVLEQADVLINATSVGMYPDVDRTLVKGDIMHSGLVVNDIVYEPLTTRLLREAKDAGAQTISGLGMLTHQGAASFELWTGKKAPIDVMRAAVRKKLREGKK